METATLLAQINATPFTGRRRLVAIAGPPASGKSTLAEALVEGHANMCALPMDGYHLSNDLLDARGLRSRKGAPDTFDARGFLHLIGRLKSEADVFYPTFDRHLDASINASGYVGPQIQTVVIEGNYLLLDHDIWRDLSDHWDLSVRLVVPQQVLVERLIARWRHHGFNDTDAKAKAMTNDIPNALTVADHSLPADITITVD